MPTGLEALNELPLNLPFALDINYFISLLVPTLVGAIALLIAMEIVHERPHYGRALIVAFLANYTVPIAFSMFGSYFSSIPYGFYVLGILVWIVLVKLFFISMPLKHAVWIGILGYGINMGFSIFGLPSLVKKIISGFIPSV